MHQNYELFVISLPLGDLTPTTKEVLEFLNSKKKHFIIDAAASILVDFTQILKMNYCLGITLSFNGNKVITAGGGGIIMSAYPNIIEHTGITLINTEWVPMFTKIMDLTLAYPQ